MISVVVKPLEEYPLCLEGATLCSDQKWDIIFSQKNCSFREESKEMWRNPKLKCLHFTDSVWACQLSPAPLLSASHCSLWCCRRELVSISEAPFDTERHNVQVLHSSRALFIHYKHLMWLRIYPCSIQHICVCGFCRQHHWQWIPVLRIRSQAIALLAMWLFPLTGK